jgi:hypothetical protein
MAATLGATPSVVLGWSTKAGSSAALRYPQLWRAERHSTHKKPVFRVFSPVRQPWSSQRQIALCSQLLVKGWSWLE